MVRVIDYGLSSLGSSPFQGLRIVFLGNTLYCYSASLLLGVETGTEKFSFWNNPAWTNIPSRDKCNATDTGIYCDCMDY